MLPKIQGQAGVGKIPQKNQENWADAKVQPSFKVKGQKKDLLYFALATLRTRSPLEAQKETRNP